MTSDERVDVGTWSRRTWSFMYKKTRRTWLEKDIEILTREFIVSYYTLKSQGKNTPIMYENK